MKELQQKSAVDAGTVNSAAHQNAAAELAHRLKEKLYIPNNLQGLNDWKKKKLKLIRKSEEATVVTLQASGQEKGEEVPLVEEVVCVEASDPSVEEEQSGLHPSAVEIGNHTAT